MSLGICCCFLSLQVGLEILERKRSEQSAPNKEVRKKGQGWGRGTELKRMWLSICTWNSENVQFGITPVHFFSNSCYVDASGGKKSALKSPQLEFSKIQNKYLAGNVFRTATELYSARKCSQEAWANQKIIKPESTVNGNMVKLSWFKIYKHWPEHEKHTHSEKKIQHYVKLANVKYLKLITKLGFLKTFFWIYYLKWDRRKKHCLSSPLSPMFLSLFITRYVFLWYKILVLDTEKMPILLFQAV